MNPRRADLHALRAFADLCHFDISNSAQMCASSFDHHRSFKYSCTNWTDMAPSPTAEATRFTEPEPTSPAANTPARLVSSRNGWRFAVQCGDSVNVIPVRTKCLSSRSISGGNQSVRGVAPMKLNTAG